MAPGWIQRIHLDIMPSCPSVISFMTRQCHPHARSLCMTACLASISLSCRKVCVLMSPVLSSEPPCHLILLRLSLPPDSEVDFIAAGSQYRRYLKGRRFSEAFELVWRIIGCEGSYSAPHVDGGGMNTWVRILNGVKAWAIRWRGPEAENVPELLPHKEDAMRWTLLFPKPGDIM